MTGMPEMVALFNGFGGAASALVASFRKLEMDLEGDKLPVGLGATVNLHSRWMICIVGWMTLSGSLLAMYKLKGGVEIFGKWTRPQHGAPHG